MLWTRWQASISFQLKWPYIHLSVLERSHFSFPQNAHIRAVRDLRFDVNSHLYSLEHTHKSSNPLCFWSTDSSSFPSCRTKNLDGCQSPITTDPADQSSAVHWIPHAGHHTESTCNHFFPLKSQPHFIISESYISAWWKWERRSRATKHSGNSHCKRNINFSIHQTILPPNE